MSNYVAPTGYVDLDNDCTYALDRKSTRSREEVNPKEDLAFYFDTYIVPKYGLNNLNVSNVASFMKDLEMNWSKLDPSLKGNVLDIMVDGIFSKESPFKEDFLKKLGATTPAVVPATVPGTTAGTAPGATPGTTTPGVSTFGGVRSKSGFGGVSNNTWMIILAIAVIGIVAFFMFKKNK